MAITHFTRTIVFCTGFLLASILPLSAAPKSCISPDAYHAAFAKRFPNDVSQINIDTILTGVQAKAFLARFNVIPPFTQIVADEVAVFKHTVKSQRLVAMFQDGCFVRDSFLRLKLYQRIMRLAELELPQHI